MKPVQRVAKRERNRYVCLHCRKVWNKSVWYTRSPRHISVEDGAMLAFLEEQLHPTIAKRFRRDAELAPFQTQFACPQCQGHLIAVHPQFKAPSVRNQRGWRQVRVWLLAQLPQGRALTYDEALRRRKGGWTPQELEKPDPCARLREWNGERRN